MATEHEIISDAIAIVGSGTSNAAIDRNVPRKAVSLQMASRVRELNRRIGGTSAAKRVTFDGAANQQTYPLSDIADDISAIDNVIRSDANIPQTDCEDDYWPIEVDTMHEGAFYDTLKQQDRYLLSKKYSWEVLVEDGERTLFLYPTPKKAIKIQVEYRSTGSSIEDLPDVARQAVTYAAVVAILDLQINRVDSMPTQTADHVPTSDDRVRMLMKQRDRYEELYNRELNELR